MPLSFVFRTIIWQLHFIKTNSLSCCYSLQYSMNRIFATGTFLLRSNFRKVLNNPAKNMVSLEEVVENNKHSQEIINSLKNEVNYSVKLNN